MRNGFPPSLLRAGYLLFGAGLSFTCCCPAVIIAEQCKSAVGRSAMTFAWKALAVAAACILR
jgi:hypothetical protein